MAHLSECHLGKTTKFQFGNQADAVSTRKGDVFGNQGIFV
jgi:hypothetical protein